MDVSIIIPTMNRPKLLLRLIHYYGSLEFRGKILIGDSSNAEIFQETASALENYKGRLDICHRHLPGRSVAAAVMDMSEYLRTPYVCLAPDDDFIVPRTIEKCIQFLDGHPDYIAAHGMGILIASADGRPDCISAAGYYRQPVLSDRLASDRVLHHLRNYSVSLFSTHRAEVWKQVFEATPSVKDQPLCCDRSFSDELLQCVLTAAYGKIAQIDGLYLVRQTHDARYLLPDWYRWLTSEKWHPSYLWFRDKVVAAICEVDGSHLQHAQDAVDTGFAEYLRKYIGARAAGPEGLVARIRQIARRHLPKSVKAALRGQFRPLSLEALMDSSSPYYRDFLQIYNAVTRKDT